MARYGYSPADVPILQAADLFLTRAGDQILHKLFSFERHGVSLALRPEFTSPALRRYLDEFSDALVGDAFPAVRWQFAGIIFEDDPASRRIDYERVSSGAECIGLAGPGAEAEVIGMAVEGCRALGIHSTHIVLGNMQLVRQLLNNYGLESRTQEFVLAHLPALIDPARGIDYVLERFDALLLAPAYTAALSAEHEAQHAFELVLESTERGITMGGRTQAAIALRLIQKRRRAAQREPLHAVLAVLHALAHIDGDAVTAFAALRQQIGSQDANLLHILDEWQSVTSLLVHYGIAPRDIAIKPVLARDWEYYSGLVFEIYADDVSGQRHVAGGGRYDELARLLGAAVDIPAVGFVYYISELLAFAASHPPSHDIWTLVAEHTQPEAIRWAQMLRARGLAVQLQPAMPVTSLNLVLDGAALRFGSTTYSVDQIDDLVARMTESLQ
jgi:histidyl-tRNA synthetase